MNIGNDIKKGNGQSIIFDQRFLKKSLIKIIQMGWLSHDFQNSNGIPRPTVFEVRMRKIDLAVDSTRAIVFCAPKHKFIELIKRSYDGQHGANGDVKEIDPYWNFDENIFFPIYSLEPEKL